MSFASDQNCAITDRLKMPTQTKKTTPRKGTRQPRRRVEELQVHEEEAGQPEDEPTPPHPRVSQPYAGTKPMSVAPAGRRRSSYLGAATGRRMSGSRTVFSM